jgi:hypothetical protein
LRPALNPKRKSDSFSDGSFFCEKTFVINKRKSRGRISFFIIMWVKFKTKLFLHWYLLFYFLQKSCPLINMLMRGINRNHIYNTPEIFLKWIAEVYIKNVGIGTLFFLNSALWQSLKIIPGYYRSVGTKVG